jgi:hypothetical protein
MLQVLSRVLGYLWALPNTALGLCFTPLALLSGGKLRTERGAIEIYGGLVQPFLVRLCSGAGCMTLGHVILGQHRAVLDEARNHEHVHVEQYMRWGPLFLPLYALSSFLCWRRGQDAYFENRFEKEAHARYYCP